MIRNDTKIIYEKFFTAYSWAADIPTILLSPLSGVLADRADRRNIMVTLDALTGVSVLCAVLALSGKNDLAVISILLVILSVLGAFETPTVQACIPSMLEGDNITKENAVVNQVSSLSYLTAPMAGGFLYSIFGLKPVMYTSVGCFFITALSRFFVMGITLVGLPYLVRSVLGLSARHYGFAESALAVATISGSIAAGLLTGKLKADKLPLLLTFLGLFMLPAGMAFLLPWNPIAF